MNAISTVRYLDYAYNKHLFKILSQTQIDVLTVCSIKVT